MLGVGCIRGLLEPGCTQSSLCMFFQDILAQIKTESRIKDDSTFDAYVLNLMNEMFIEAVQSARPFELRNEVFLYVDATTGYATLPADFFLYHQVLFQDSQTNREYLLTDQDEASQPAPRGLYGHPTSFEVQSGQIVLNPLGGIITGDQIRLIYYKTPPVVTLSNISQLNPISRLEPYLIRTCVRRVRLFHTDDPQVTSQLTGDITSAAAAYSKDEPEYKNPLKTLEAE